MDQDALLAGGEQVEVDRCMRCGGTYLDFFDGEPSVLSRALVPAVHDGTAVPEGALICPDCMQPMVRKRYLDSKLELARCEGCMAVFLTPAELRELAKVELEPEKPPEHERWIDRLSAWLRGT